MADQQPSRTEANRSNGKRRSGGSAPRAAAPKRPGAARIAHLATQAVEELIGKEIEGVTGLERTDDGWLVEVDVLELRRVPATTDVLATYEVAIGTNGSLQGYRRIRRYVRGETGQE